jgi:hypothetical protein
MEQFRLLPRNQLEERGQLLYGRMFEHRTAGWEDSDWERFNRKLFDISSLMQQINGRYGCWFNRRFQRRGHFWGDRFKNPELLDLPAVQECLLYIELNAVRAGLVRRPEQWKAGSARLRWKQKDRQLMPLQEIFGGRDPQEAYQLYRSRLYHRGAIPSREGQAVISRQILEKESRRGFHRTGLYRERLRFYSDGLALGRQKPVQQLLDQFRNKQLYVRRKHPIPQLSGMIFSLKEQRTIPINGSPVVIAH